MKKFLILVFCFASLAACDLRQYIVDAPNNIGDFIATRYPALLADPNTEIYEYASVLDYGGPSAAAPNIRDYLIYAPGTDYMMPDQSVMREQTISEISKDYGTLSVLEKKSFILNTREIAVEKGDTANSIAKKYNMPLARLAVLNDLKEPYALAVGKTLKVEVAEIVTTKTETPKTEARPAETPPASPAVRLPKLDARAGSLFSWPVRGDIISDFGPKKNGLTNDGINIGAPIGTDVAAADNGVVAYAGNELKGMGNLLIIQHAGGWMTVYAHLDGFVVKRGDKVAAGQKIGAVGKTGKVSEPQLHFEIRKGSKAYDPKKQMK